MARLAVTLPDELLKLARETSARTEVPLRGVVESAIRRFVSTACGGSSPLAWPPPVRGKRALTAQELCDAIAEGRE
jgi:hypothetical protein